MSFRLKIGLSFCSILLLTITVAVASWWGMHSALQRQNSIFTFSLEVDRLFNSMAAEEHTFSSSQEIRSAQAVNNILDELRLIIGDVEKQFNRKYHPMVEHILMKLQQYQDNFADYTQQIIRLETMQSRMNQESSRLLAHTSSLTNQESDISAALLLQTSRMFQAEKTYMLSGTKGAAETVIKIIADIEILTKQVTKQTDVDNMRRLKAYRIAKVATVYRDIFNRYLDEDEGLRHMVQSRHHAQENLATELRTFIDNELALSQRQVNRLQLFTVAVSLVAIALSAFITLFLSDRITRPLEHLKNSAREIVNGNLNTVVSLHTKDEIGQLGDIFNQMTLKLRQNFDDIAGYRNHLEELVEERTRDLKKEMATRNAAEKALRSSEEQLRTIVDQSPMGIILWNTAFQVKQWNPAAEKIFGYSMEEAIDLPAAKLMPQSMQPHMAKIWQKLISSEAGIRSHNENVRQDGRTIHCDWFNSPICDASGAILGALSLVENVTERMRMEKELLKIEKLESTGILAGGIAHDFNNILTAVLGNINLSIFDDSLSPKTRNLLVAAEKAAIRAKDLTQQLLTFAKGGEPIRESTSLAEIVRESATFVLHGGNVSCTYQLPDNLWYAVVDRGQISQVIQNIVLNARHAMPKGGNIAIVCQNILPAEEPFSLLDAQNIYVKISIQDTGVGIPAELLDKVFDPYFSTKQEGSGLGLAITHSIINKHHGHILVNSELGKGTEFIIYLPAASPTSVAGNVRQKVPTTAPHQRILVMDDDQAVQMVLQKMLQILGHSVILTSDGWEAINIYRERCNSAEAIDLVIVDLTIPGGIGGKETLVRLQQIDPTIRAIVSSGYSNDPVMASFQEHGFCAAVNKPYVLQELQAAIETALSYPAPSKKA
jgi:PAS domain S-box-containing protein